MHRHRSPGHGIMHMGVSGVLALLVFAAGAIADDAPRTDVAQHAHHSASGIPDRAAGHETAGEELIPPALSRIGGWPLPPDGQTAPAGRGGPGGLFPPSVFCAAGVVLPRRAAAP